MRKPIHEPIKATLEPLEFLAIENTTKLLGKAEQYHLHVPPANIQQAQKIASQVDGYNLRARMRGPEFALGKLIVHSDDTLTSPHWYLEANGRRIGAGGSREHARFESISITSDLTVSSVEEACRGVGVADRYDLYVSEDNRVAAVAVATHVNQAHEFPEGQKWNATMDVFVEPQLPSGHWYVEANGKRAGSGR